jgi:predicted RNA methylase
MVVCRNYRLAYSLAHRISTSLHHPLDAVGFDSTGAGSGIFTIPIAKFTNKIVYAVELDLELLSVIENKAKKEGLNNVRTIKANDETISLDVS